MIFFAYFRKELLSLLCLLCLYITASAQKAVQVRAVYDTSAIPELFNTVSIGFTFIYPDGSKLSTRGLLQGRLRWKDLHVTTPQGTVQNGKLTFDRTKVWKNNHSVTFYLKTGDTKVTADLPLPYVEKIRFNLYTDSLKRSNPFYLNVEGLFSSGHTYPLDTGMVAFSKSGGGTLMGNALSVTPADTAVSAVQVYARLKADTALRDSIMIPVKITPDPGSLPTEQDLLNDWKKKKYREPFLHLTRFSVPLRAAGLTRPAPAESPRTGM